MQFATDKAVIEVETTFRQTFPHRVFTLRAAIEMMLYVVVFRKHLWLQQRYKKKKKHREHINYTQTQ